MRSPTLLAPTNQTPALPGFGVYGDAKSAGFGSLGTSPGVCTNRLVASVSDQLALGALTGGSCVDSGAAVLTGDRLPFERVQMGGSTDWVGDHRSRCGCGWGARLAECSWAGGQCGRGSGLTKHSWSAGQGECNADAGRPGQPKCGRGSESKIRGTEQRRFVRRRCAAGPVPHGWSAIERVQMGVHGRLEGAAWVSDGRVISFSFERVQMTRDAGEITGSRPALAPFERVQMGLGSTTFYRNRGGHMGRLEFLPRRAGALAQLSNAKRRTVCTL